VSTTIRQLWERYKHIRKARLKRFRATKSYWENHIIPGLGEQTAETLTRSTIESWLVRLPLAPNTANQILVEVKSVLSRAVDDGLWDASKLLWLRKVEPIRVPHREKSVLTRHEASCLLELGVAPQEWRPVFAFAIYMGPRKGEILRVRIEHIEWERHLITIPERKAGQPLVSFPIPEECMPFLWEARWRAESLQSEWLFPNPKGERRAEDAKPGGVLRTALLRCGVNDGWQHHCRKAGCGWSENAKAAGERLCPTCGNKLKVRAIPRRIRFHDLRGTAISLHTEAGCHQRVIDVMVGHAFTDMGGQKYLRMSTEFIRSEVEKLSLRMSGGVPPNADHVSSDEPTSDRPSSPGSQPVGGTPQAPAGPDATAQLLSYSQVASILGVSERTVRRYYRSWGLRIVRLDRHPRFVRSDVDALIARLRDK
jgi:integrase